MITLELSIDGLKELTQIGYLAANDRALKSLHHNLIDKDSEGIRNKVFKLAEHA